MALHAVPGAQARLNLLPEWPVGQQGQEQPLERWQRRRRGEARLEEPGADGCLLVIGHGLWPLLPVCGLVAALSAAAPPPPPPFVGRLGCLSGASTPIHRRITAPELLPTKSSRRVGGHHHRQHRYS